MTTVKRSLVILGIGTAVALLTVVGVWLASRRPTVFYTDGGTIRVPAHAAPMRSVLWQPARPLPGSINSTSDEYEPRLSADGTLMVFVRGKPGANADLYQSRLTAQGWSEPTPISEVNTSADELGPELSPDGRSLYFYSDRPGGLGGYDLWVATATDDGWSTPVNLGPGVNTSENEYGPAISPDGRELFFASNRPRPGEPTPERDAWAATVRETRDRHDYDLYVSSLAESGAQSAEPITALNTPADEGAPALSPAGDFLYFASDRHGGHGGFDIYRARRGADGFANPENVGSAINSAFSDLDPALSYDGFRLHFSSNRPMPDAASDAEDAPVDYGVWFSRSREVYRHAEASAASFTDLLAMVVPWLVLLLLLLLLALILPRLWMDQRLAQRFRRLSLLAQCLLVSLALHILIASLLTLWKVGSKISEMIAEQGGGTRVVLASSAADGDGFGTQIRGGLTDEPALPGAPDVGMAALSSPAIGSEAVETSVSATSVRDDERLARNNETERRNAARTSLPAETPRPDDAIVASDPAAPSELPAPAPVSESTLAPRAAIEPAPSSAPEVRAIGASPVVIAPSATAARDGAAAALADGPRGDATQAPSPAMTSWAPAASHTSIAGATPRAEGPAAPSSEARDVGAPAIRATAASAPAGAELSAPGRIETDVGGASIGDTRIAANIDAALAPSASGPAGASPPVAPALVAATAEPLGDVATPSSAGGTAAAPTTEATLGTPSALAAVSGAPRASAGSELIGGTGSVRADPGRSAASDGARAAIATPDSTAAPGSGPSPPSNGAILAPPGITSTLAGVATPGVPAGGGGGATTEASLSLGGTLGGSDALQSAPAGLGVNASTGPVHANPGVSGAADHARAALSIPSTTNTTSAGGASAPTPTAMQLPGASSGTVAHVAIPGVGGGNGEGRAAPKTEARAGGLAPIVTAAPGAGVGGGTSLASTPGSVKSDPGASRAGDDGARATLDAGRAGASNSSVPSAPSPGSLPLAGAGGGPPALALSLPVVEEPPAPKETFEQRAPEVRTELLTKGGGSAETERAVGRALDWFARHQEPDGRWTGRRFDDRCRECGGAAEFDSDAAMTGLALLCYLGAGHTHGNAGPYRQVVRKGIDFLLNRQDASGDLRHDETMYSQSIATVALCEAYAMTRDKRVGDAAKRAVEFMCEGVRRAAVRGGRQSERARADDTSVLGWQVMAMESARRCGIDVPDTTFRSAAAFLDKVSSGRSRGRYAYRPGEAPSAAMTAEAMFVQQLMGQPADSARMRESAAFILESPPRWKDGAYTYYWYYATLALFQHQGEAWKRWNDALVPELLANQRNDGGAAGSWDPQDQWSRMGGRIYQTAVCTLSLEVYYRYKPAGTQRAGR